MKIKKIDVKTSNKKHATDIAMLVDKPEFLKKIDALREKWKINDRYQGKDEIFDEGAILFYTGLNKKEAEERLPEFNTDINNILKSFNRGRNFRLVVIYALITGSVPERVYKSCYFDIVTINEPEDINKPENYQYVIILSPRTEKQEVVQVYKEFKQHIKGYEAKNEFEMAQIGKIEFENMSYDNKFNMENPDDVAIIERYYKGKVYNSADIDKFKTHKELERTREWYWLAYSDQINGLTNKRKGSEDILTDWLLQKCPVKTAHFDIESKKECPYCSLENINDIDQALSTYVKLLHQS